MFAITSNTVQIRIPTTKRALYYYQVRTVVSPQYCHNDTTYSASKLWRLYVTRVATRINPTSLRLHLASTAITVVCRLTSDLAMT